LADEVWAARLKAARIAAEFKTAKAFAAKLGISANRYSRYENGTRPKLEMLTRICSELGITAEYLFGRPEAPAGRAPRAAGSTPGKLNSSGFSDELLTSSQQTTGCGPAESVIRLDAIYWRLAEALLDLRIWSSLDDKESHRRRRPPSYPETVEVFAHLRSLPFDTPIEMVRAAGMRDLPPDLNSKLRSAMEALIAHIEKHP